MLRLPGCVYHHACLLICTSTPSHVVTFRPNVAVIRQDRVMADRALRSALEAAGTWNPVEIERRAQLGDSCYLVLDGARCVHYSWLTRRHRAITEIGLEATLDGQNSWIYDCYTAPTHRGRAIYPHVLQHILEDAEGDNGSRVWIDVEDFNVASLRGIAKAGFVPVARVERTVLLSGIVLGQRKTIVNAVLGQHFTRLPSRWVRA